MNLLLQSRLARPVKSSLPELNVMSDKENEEQPSRDLRDSTVWALWRDMLPEDDRWLVKQAAMTYVPVEDTLILMFPFASQAELGDEGFSRVVDAIRSFYDSNRQRWMVGIEDLRKAGKPPRDAIMPNIVVEVAPPISQVH